MVHLKKSVYVNPENIHAFAVWLQSISPHWNEEDLNFIRRAYQLSLSVKESGRVLEGVSCVQQGLTMAEVLLDLNLDRETVAAAMIYGSCCYAELQLDAVRRELGDSVIRLVKGALQMNAIHNVPIPLSKLNFHRLENIRKMFLAMVKDVRVILTKLAERITMMRFLERMDNASARLYAEETLNIYAPLANRLGIDQLKWEFEDRALHYLDPVAYKNVARLLNEPLLKRRHYIQEQAEQLQLLLRNSGLKNCQVQGRVKHIYSIYRKMQRKKLFFSQLYDLNALRIQVDTVEECYQVLGMVQNLWSALSREFDDYIAVPKANGYRSLHTVVRGPGKKWIEIQIRTYQMHQESERGIAAHWQYKEGIQQESSYHTKIAWFRHILEWQQSLVKQGCSVVLGLKSAFDDRIYLFTPAGDVIDLPKSATPLDFAYHIHSQIGHRCRGAKVNGVIVPLTYTLQTGEQVEVLTSQQDSPSRDWLNSSLGYLHTAQARAKVRHWFRVQDYDKYCAEGQLLFEKECRRLGVSNIDQESLAAALHFKSKKDLFSALGGGNLRLAQILPFLKETKPSGEKSEKKLQKALKETHLSSLAFTLPKEIRVGGLSRLLSQIAGCCKPLPGDSIIGFITRGKGVRLHRDGCRNVVNLQLILPERFVEVSWKERNITRVYSTDIFLKTYNRKDLIEAVSTLLFEEKLNLISLKKIRDKSDAIVNFKLTLEIPNLKILEKFLARVKNIPEIISVRRNRLKIYE